MSTFLRFADITPSNRKTKIISVTDLNEKKLGEIRFWGAWRQYTFQPTDNTVFDSKCMIEIIDKMDQFNLEVRNEWRKRRKNKIEN